MLIEAFAVAGDRLRGVTLSTSEGPRGIPGGRRDRQATIPGRLLPDLMFQRDIADNRISILNSLSRAVGVRSGRDGDRVESRSGLQRRGAGEQS